jgi:DNA polymerase
MNGQDDRRRGRALLEWYVAAGVDIGIEAAPVDRLSARAQAEPELDSAFEAALAGKPRAEGTGRLPEPAPPAPSLPKPVAADNRATGEQALGDAHRLAAEARDLSALETALSTFKGCGLAETASRLCFADGNPKARLMIIGEAPGREEDRQGKPFVGRAGQLLDRMLAAIGLDRTSVYITNIVFWRPPGNRNPTPMEGAICRPITERQIELIAPDIILLLGGVAAKHVLETAEGIMRLRGKWRQIAVAGRKIPVMASLHPAYLLRQPLQKRLAWRDFLAIRKALDERNGQ